MKLILYMWSKLYTLDRAFGDLGWIFACAGFQRL